MTKRIVSFEVDQSALFDMLHKMGGDTTDIGQRVIGVLLADTGFIDALGMALYGITLLPSAPSGEGSDHG